MKNQIVKTSAPQQSLSEISSKDLGKANLQTITRLCNENDIPTEIDGKARPKLHMLMDLQDKHKTVRVARVRQSGPTITPTPEMQAILDNAEMKKSHKINALNELGVARQQIAKLMNTNASYVYNVLERAEYNKIIAERNAQNQPIVNPAAEMVEPNLEEDEDQPEVPAQEEAAEEVEVSTASRRRRK